MGPVEKLLNKGLAKQERQLGNPYFIFKGQKIPCAPGQRIASNYSMEFGGPEEQVECEIVVRKGLFKTAAEITVDSTSITIDDSGYATDRFGNIFKTIDIRRATLEVWLQVKRALTIDNDSVTIDENCKILVDNNQAQPGQITIPGIDSIVITIDADGNVTLDGDITDLAALPGKQPVTIDNDTITLSNNLDTLTIDRHVDCYGYFDPVFLPDLNNIYQVSLDTDIEQAKSDFELSPSFAATIDDNGLTLDNNLLTVDADSPVWERQTRVDNVFQEDQGMNYGARPEEGDILVFRDKEFRVVSVEDPGAYGAFYRLQLGNARN
jgi:hypothetical protein